MPGRGGMGRQQMARRPPPRPGAQRMTPQAQAAGGRGQQAPQQALQAQRQQPPQAAAQPPGMEAQRQATQAQAMAPQSQVANRQMSPQAATALAAQRPGGMQDPRAAGLGLGLGLNAQQRGRFLQAAQTPGGGQAFLGSHPGIAQRVENRIPGGSPRDTALQNMMATGQAPSGAQMRFGRG